ncbi:protein jim lovell [Nasonia vitripennis]|uniref:Protein jim lovell n=1 Tax=Nasonia vitripennis TaxID=7425 RepID=A0A7M7Q4A5_NASVI|nr:protein jim lovell [Nasonia vitripennis]XP_031780067.1 protein jim lovell [Nasonia vitripennis]
MSCSAAEESPDGMAVQSHYSLRWNNHQTHILQAFEALLHAEVLVDVTLVCADQSLRAHKVVLSVCSPFFERIFAEHPCKHPVIVLKDFPGREIMALIDFMYRGEVRVGREDLPGLIHAAESLQIRGLASSEPRLATPPITPTTDVLMQEPATPEPARQTLSPREDEEEMSECATPSSSAGGNPHSNLLHREHREHSRLPHMGHLNFNNLRELRDGCGSPLMPRRKQARPRRRSGELPQDLSRPHPPPSLSPPSQGLNLSSSSTNSSGHNQQREQPQSEQPPRSPSNHELEQEPTMPEEEEEEEEEEEVAENLSMKRELKRSLSPAPSTDGHAVKSESEAASSPRGSPLAATPGGGAGLHPDTSFSDLPAAGLTAMSALSLTPPQHHGSEYLTSLGQFAAQWLPNHHHQQQQQQQQPGQHPRHPRDGSPHGGKPGSGGAQGPPPPGFPFQQGESPLAARGAFPGLDGMTPLFPHGPPLDLHDSFKPESFHGLFVGASLGHHHPHHPGKKPKKHRSDGIPRRWSDHSRGLPVCRPKGQHSAPRGGPPRSWTNADLTEALTMVWNKKMTTSQASRVYGIPYNSLLMYVRGKYGKSLKLEQLRRDCTAGEVLNSLNNNAVKQLDGGAAPPPPPPPPPPPGSHPRLPPLPPGLHEAEANFAHHPLLSGGLAQGFFPDFGSFPVPVNMVHLLPPSEQKAFEPPTKPQPGNNSASNGQREQRPEEQQLRSRSPSPAPVSLGEGLMPPPAQSAPALLQQNGAD